MFDSSRHGQQGSREETDSPDAEQPGTEPDNAEPPQISGINKKYRFPSLFAGGYVP